MLAHAYNIIIDHAVGELGHDRVVVDVLNYNYKLLLSMFITTLQLPGASYYDS